VGAENYQAPGDGMETVRELLDQDRFARHAGIELVSVSPGQAVARMAIQPHHRNGLQVVEGGALFTLGDFAFAAASNSRGRVAVGINASITFMKAARTGVLRAEAREASLNPKLGAYTVHITDEQGGLIAVFQGLVYRKKEPLAPVG